MFESKKEEFLTFETFKPKRLKERKEKLFSGLIKHIKEMDIRTPDLKNASEFIEKSKQTIHNYMELFWKLEDDEKVEQIDNLRTIVTFLQELKINSIGLSISLSNIERSLKNTELLEKYREYSFEIDENLLENHGLSLTLSREINRNLIHIEFNFFKEKKQMVAYYTKDRKHVKSYHGKLVPLGDKYIFWFECDPDTFGLIYELIALDGRFKITRESKKNHYKIEKF